MDPQIIATAVLFILIALPLLLAFVVYKWWRASRRLGIAERMLLDESARTEESAKSNSALANANAILEDSIAYLQDRFGPAVDLDQESLQLQVKIDEQQRDIEGLRAQYVDKKKTYDRLLSEIAIFDERLAFAEMGVYEPHFDFTDSEDYKAGITATRNAQKILVSRNQAVISTTVWTVDGSVSKGETMMKRNIKLSLRAFNSECDATIANARWNNINAMEKRIIRTQESIDKLNSSNAIVITMDYLKLKLDKLYLTHEHREKLKEEREVRAEAARKAKEEQRLIRDMERAKDDEEHYARLLAKAKAEAASTIGPKLDAFTEQVRMLEKDLAEAKAKVARAVAMAERTRSGYIYIISNIGSFGESVVKIGLTRRLDPIDRIKELGDASVPFGFDIHAIIYSEDAPALERALHNEFESLRINTQNLRKEFFRTSLDEVELALKRVAPQAPFFKDIEAQEYRETLARRRDALEIARERETQALPISL